MHYVQMVKSGRFAMFDYGSSSENQRQYGSVSSASLCVYVVAIRILYKALIVLPFSLSLLLIT